MNTSFVEMAPGIENSQQEREYILACFGCFNPPTNGHLSAIMAAADRLRGEGKRVERAVMIPVHSKYAKAGLLPSEIRIEMCRMMVSGIPFIEVDDAEAKKETWSRTIDTLDYLQGKYPGRTILIVCGIDVVASYERSWRQQDIIRIATEFGLVVFGRDGVEIDDITRFCSWLTGRTQNICVVENGTDFSAICSTKVRNAIRAHEPLCGMVSDSVMNFITERGLYSD